MTCSTLGEDPRGLFGTRVAIKIVSLASQPCVPLLIVVEVGDL